MRVDCALLCDAVTVRDGLLHVLGGGVTQIMRPAYPAPLGVALALRIMIHPTETAAQHRCQVLLQNSDGAQLANADVTFAVEGAGDTVPGEEHSLALPLPLQNVGIPEPGEYSIEILIHGIHQVSVPFAARLAAPGAVE